MTEFSELKKLEAAKQSDTISRMVDEWELKIQEADSLLETLETRRNELSKELIDLRDKIKKGEHNLRKLNSEKRVIERAFWRAK